MCIRPALGYCCVSWEVCNGVTNAYTLQVDAAIAQAYHDNACTIDYIEIPGNVTTFDKFSGKLS